MKGHVYRKSWGENRNLTMAGLFAETCKVMSILGFSEIK